MSRGGSSSLELLPIVLAVLFTTACAAPPSRPAAAPQPKTVRLSATSALVEEARARGLSVDDPLTIDTSLLHDADSAVGRWGNPHERLRRLVAYLNDENRLGFQYAPNLSLTAAQAFHERRGDCIAYTNLFIAISRYLGLPTYYVHVSEVLSHYEHRGLFFTSSHVAVGYGSGPSAVVVDFTKSTTDWKLAIYRAVDDATAAALYYNNLAVDAMMNGDLDEAERMLRFLIEKKPEVEETYNNLGVVLNRKAKYQEALAVLERGMKAFPTYKPLYTNGLVAARGAKRADLEKDFELRGQEIADRNPYFLFARGMSSYQSGELGQAVDELEKAARMKPDSAVIYAWLARACFTAGKLDKAREATEEVRKLAPNSKILSDLEAELAATPR
ncbi:MAG: tetratricopeptide repeat protein [Polyangiaceae bacterium]|nr:tetratricopeptide repeat protein [Polyangiaceae bacterium]